MSPILFYFCRNFYETRFAANSVEVWVGFQSLALIETRFDRKFKIFQSLLFMSGPGMGARQIVIIIRPVGRVASRLQSDAIQRDHLEIFPFLMQFPRLCPRLNRQIVELPLAEALLIDIVVPGGFF